jgi:hypothetical protein
MDWKVKCSIKIQRKRFYGGKLLAKWLPWATHPRNSKHSTKDQNKMKSLNKLQTRMITLTCQPIQMRQLRTTKSSSTNSTKSNKSNSKTNKSSWRTLCNTRPLVLLELEDTLKRRIMLSIRSLLSSSFHNSTATICTFWRNSCRICKWN